jgi:hypothetical protein
LKVVASAVMPSNVQLIPPDAALRSSATQETTGTVELASNATNP